MTPQQPPHHVVRVLPPGTMESELSITTELRKPRISFELYPPRTENATESVWRAVQELAAWNPRCFSVTYPSSDTGRVASYGLVKRILAETDIAPVAHLTVVGASRAELIAYVRELFRLGVRDFLALRGDPEPGQDWVSHPDGLNYASDLVTLIRGVEVREREEGRDLGRVSVGCAVYPHAGAEFRHREFVAMRAKHNAGSTFAITQVFYNVAQYAALVDGAPRAGVPMPILPGIIPLTDPARLGRLAKLTGVEVPAHIAALAELDDDERFARGIQLTADLVEQSIAAGAPGVHVFTFNQARPSVALCHELAARGIIDNSAAVTPAVADPASPR